MVNDVSLDKAIADENSRQAYLNGISMGDIDICSGLVYDPEGKLRTEFPKTWMRDEGIGERVVEAFARGVVGDRKDYYAGVGAIPMLIGRIRNMPLFVGKKLFDGFFSDGEIRHTLRTHEVRHIQQQVKGFEYFDNTEFIKDYVSKRITPKAFVNMTELDSNTYSLRNLSGYEIRKPYVQGIVERANRDFVSLENGMLNGLNETEKRYVGPLLDAVSPK